MTTIVRWHPVRDVNAIQNAVDRFFNDTWRSDWRNWNQMAEEDTAGAAPLAVDVYESDSDYVVIASLPGVNADNIDVKFHDGFLTIQAELSEPVIEREGTRALLQERLNGKFSRRIRLARPINVGAVETSYVNGVLTLTLPKAEEAQPRVIPVQVQSNGK